MTDENKKILEQILEDFYNFINLDSSLKKDKDFIMIHNLVPD